MFKKKLKLSRGYFGTLRRTAFHKSWLSYINQYDTTENSLEIFASKLA